MDVPPSTVTALRMRFPADRSFVFMVEYDDVVEVGSGYGRWHPIPEPNL